MADRPHVADSAVEFGRPSVIHPLIVALVEARKAAGLSRRDLAARMHLSVAYVGEMERGRYSTTLANLDRWARALGFTLAVVRDGSPS